MSNVQSTRPVVELGPALLGRNEPLSREEQEKIADQIQTKRDERNEARLKVADEFGKATQDSVAKIAPTVQPTEGYLLLDENGKPGTEVVFEVPVNGEPYVTVKLVTPLSPDDVMTSSGAPLTEQMNPEHSFKDAGMEERNPTPPPIGAPKEAQEAHKQAVKAAADRAAGREADRVKADAEKKKIDADLQAKKAADEAAKAKAAPPPKTPYPESKK
jgi:hypothetical protein